MKKNWAKKKFESVFKIITPPSKIKASEVLTEGEFPVISQDNNFINGYWNHASDVVKIDSPVVIFGDHTRATKYVDFDFVQGADGIKILQATKDLIPRFLFYAILNCNFKSLGYARHFKILKKAEILFPTYLGEQERIVGIIDKAFEKINAIQRNAEENLQQAKEMFHQALADELTPQKNWKLYKLPRICKELFAGGDVPKDNFSKSLTPEYTIPIYANAATNHGLYGYTNIIRVKEPAITISARGTIGHAEIRMNPFYPIVRLIVVVPNLKLIDLNFLYWLLCNKTHSNTGVSIPQLTIPMVKKYELYMPEDIQQQVQIAHNLDTLSALCSLLEQNFRETVACCEEMKKAVLAKAFRGEL